jgi:ribosomal protein L37AE/L43A
MNCPKCNKATNKKLIKLQLWYCNKCHKLFTSYSRAYRHEKKCDCPLAPEKIKKEKVKL